MAEQVDAIRGVRRGVTSAEALAWAAAAGLSGGVHTLERSWRSTPADEIYAITQRTWPALRSLDEATIAEVTGPAVEALRALPDTEEVRRVTAEMLVLRRDLS